MQIQKEENPTIGGLSNEFVEELFWQQVRNLSVRKPSKRTI